MSKGTDYGRTNLHRRPGVPVSFLQEAAWISEHLNRKQTGNIRQLTSITGPLDVQALKLAFVQAISRHQPLCTKIVRLDGRFSIEPLDDVESAWRETAIPGSAGDSDVAKELLNEPLSLSDGPVTSACLSHHGVDSYSMALTIHPAAADLRSLHLLNDEIKGRYIAIREGRQYEDIGTETQETFESIASQQRLAYAQGSWERSIGYWKQELTSAPPSLDIQTDKVRPNQLEIGSACVTQQVPPDLTESISRTSDALGVSVSAILHTALAVLLQRYSRQDEIPIGTPVIYSGSASDRIVGPLTNVVAVNADLTRDPTFESLARTIASSLENASQHADLPFEVLVRELNIRSDTGRHPVFQVMFEHDQTPPPRLDLPDVESEAIDIVNQPSLCDLSLVVRELNSRLTVNLAYNTSLFDQVQVRRLLDQYECLLKHAVAEPDLPVSNLKALTPAERRKLLVDWNQTGSAFPRNESLSRLVESQVAQTPEAIAVEFGDHWLTYEQLNGKANCLAIQLKALGVAPGHRIPVLMDRSLELPLSILAVMKAGAAFIPMDTHWPTERIRQIVSNSEARAVLLGSQNLLMSDLTDIDQLVVRSDSLAVDCENLESAPRAEDPIYVIYTSGSTGTPKGAVNQHRGIVNRLTYMTRRYSCSADDVILQTSAHIFDAAVWQLFWPLINGARTVLPRPMIGFDFEHVVDLIESRKVTVTDFVPSVFSILLDYLKNNDNWAAKLSSLRQILIGGEAMNPDAIATFRQMLPNVGITNTYGPTETSIGVIFYEVTDRYESPIPIGRPIDNVFAYILDDTKEPVPVGVPGNLYVGGDCVGLGYLNDPDKTATVFVEGPQPECGAAKIYKTGDLAKYREDGNIAYLGRADHQVKIRGVRVELGEIETALNRHPQVNDAVVVLREDLPGQKKLVAYYTSALEQLDVSELRQFLAQSLPEYIVPNLFVRLERFPLTKTGKVDRRALPVPAQATSNIGNDHVEPTTSTEITLSRIWADVLNLDQVGALDNFYEVGGDSLSAMMAILAVEEQLHRHIDAESMLNQNLSQLAAAIDGGDGAPRRGIAPKAQHVFPIYFGERPSLYGCYHEPRQPSRSTAVLMCYPLAHEYIRTHRSYVQLATRLARNGMATLRFDYRGTGNSEDHPCSGDVSEWIEDIATAKRELVSRSGAEKVVAFGMRLGGALAAYASAAASFEGLALWDPVLSGRQHLEECLNLHNETLRYSGLSTGPAERGAAFRSGLLGFDMPDTLVESIGRMDLTALDRPPTGEILLMSTQPTAKSSLAEIEALWRNVNVDYIPTVEIWSQDPYKTSLPSDVIRSISQWILEKA